MSKKTDDVVLLPLKTEDDDVLLPILLNGKLFSVDPTGNLAITTDGKATKLSDSAKHKSRFK